MKEFHLYVGSLVKKNNFVLINPHMLHPIWCLRFVLSLQYGLDVIAKLYECHYNIEGFYCGALISGC